MVDIQIRSVSIPYVNPPLLALLLSLISKANAMGLMRGKPIETIDASTLHSILDAVQRGGLIGTQRSQLQPLLESRAHEIPPAVIAALEATLRAIDESPVPEKEWPAMREVFGEEELARLLGVSVSSLKRYAARERSTPLDIADRLHWLAMVVADLSGSYNEFGIRRWFERPRPQLDGKSPRAQLGTRWDSTTAGAQRVRELARSLSAAGAT